MVDVVCYAIQRDWFKNCLLQEKKEYTQAQLAEKVGLSTNYLGMIERGNQGKSFSLGTLFLIAQALEVNPEELLDSKV